MSHAAASELYRPDPAKVAAQNDQFREGVFTGKTQLSGRVVMTNAISALDPDVLSELMTAVRDFDAFSEGNDAEGFHDFGAVTIHGIDVWFKIDLFERGTELRYGAEQPDNPQTTTRVLTLLLPSDW